MFLACHYVLGYLGPRVQLVGVEVAQFKAGDEQTAQTAVDVGLADVATAHSLGQMLIL